MLLEKIEPLASVLPEARKAALLKRLAKAELPTAVDGDRLLQELVIFADRYDVSEETTRLRSHFGQCRTLLGADGDSVGRNLDFLSQELQRCRRVNTACKLFLAPLFLFPPMRIRLGGNPTGYEGIPQKR